MEYSNYFKSISWDSSIFPWIFLKRKSLRFMSILGLFLFSWFYDVLQTDGFYEQPVVVPQSRQTLQVPFMTILVEEQVGQVES